MENYIHYGAQHRQKYALHRKKLQIKVVQNWILSKKVRENISSISPPPWSGARGLERLTWLKYNIALKRQITFHLGLNAAKNTH